MPLSLRTIEESRKLNFLSIEKVLSSVYSTLGIGCEPL